VSTRQSGSTRRRGRRGGGERKAEGKREVEEECEAGEAGQLSVSEAGKAGCGEAKLGQGRA
jgi:hypothetical protein